MTPTQPVETQPVETQPERTALAWQRTGLALFGATVVAGRLGMRDWPVATVLVLAPAVLLSIGMMRLAGRRYRHARAAAVDDGRHGQGGRLPFAAAAAVALLGLAALAAVLAGL